MLKGILRYEPVEYVFTVIARSAKRDAAISILFIAGATEIASSPEAGFSQ